MTVIKFFLLALYFLHFYPLGALLNFRSNFIVGILLHFCISMLAPNLVVGMMVSGSLAVIGLWRLKKFPIEKNEAKWALFYLSLLFFHAFRQVTRPLPLGDGHSNWFFPGKVFFLQGKFDLTLFSHAEYAWSHPFYPKLVGVLSAEIATLLGFWNAYWPNLTLSIMLAPLLFILLEMMRKDFLSFSARTFFILTFFFGQMTWLTNGYMDAFCAISSVLALWQMKAKRNWALGCILMSYSSVMKVEGQICSLITLALVILDSRTRYEFLNFKPIKKLVLLVLPIVIFSYQKQRIHLGDWKQSGYDLAHLAGFITETPRILQVLHGLFVTSGLFKLLSYCLPIFLFLRAKIFSWFYSFNLLYLGALFIIYLTSSLPLEWLMQVSLDRTSMSLHFLMLLMATKAIDDYASLALERKASKSSARSFPRSSQALSEQTCQDSSSL